MRLSSKAQQIIRDSTHEIFGSDATAIVFGSRVDDMASGGDIDLLVQSDKAIAQRQRKALQLVARLQIRLGDQPIDVLVLDPETTCQSVHDEALRTGVPL